MNNYNNIFLNYDVARSRRNKKIKRYTIIVSITVGVFFLSYGFFYFVLNSSLNYSIRDKESSAILYSDTEDWENPDSEIYNLAPDTASPTQTEEPTASVSPDIEATPNPEGISITQTETSIATPEPIVTRVPIQEGTYMTRDAKFTDGEIIINDSSYYSSTLSIELFDFYEYESKIFVADIYIKSLDNFVPVFAGNDFHSGYQTTSEMAKEHNAVLAINSDSATSVDYGIIIRYGQIYRDILAGDHMAIFDNGVIKTYPSRNISGEFLLDKGAQHVFCFGPKLFDDDGNNTTFDYSQYAHNRKKHPRTAIGMVAPYHYVIVVADGREDGYSEGLTLEELSELMYNLNCIEAYNLDGGGSSTMVFMDKLINRPEGGTEERAIDSAILFKETSE